MPAIVTFTLLGAEYFCTPLSTINLCSGIQLSYLEMDFPGGSVAQASACQCRRQELNPLPRKILHAKRYLSPCTTTTALVP